MQTDLQLNRQQEPNRQLFEKSVICLLSTRLKFQQTIEVIILSIIYITDIWGYYNKDDSINDQDGRSLLRSAVRHDSESRLKLPQTVILKP